MRSGDIKVTVLGEREGRWRRRIKRARRRVEGGRVRRRMRGEKEESDVEVMKGVRRRARE